MDSFNISRQRHLKNLALVWLLVGLMLGIRGMIWILGDPQTHRRIALLLPLAVLLGLFKGLIILRKSALKSAERVSRFPDYSPFWKLYNPPAYFMITGMMALGFACRWAGRHWHISGFVGMLYIIISIGLITASRVYTLAVNTLS